MASVLIRTRTIGDGSKRYDVRVRRGRYYGTEHLGTFRSRKEADLRVRRVREWLALALDPKAELEKALRPKQVTTFVAVAEEWLASRRKLDDSTRENYQGRLGTVTSKFGKRLPDQITPHEVIEWIGELEATYKPGTVGLFVSLLRMVLDFADVHPNPARDRRVELPRKERTEIEPPDADEVLAVLRRMPQRWRRLVVLIELTGMRVSEACDLTADDVDREGGRVRVKRERSKTNRPRWVDVPQWLLELLPSEGRLFPGATRQAAYNAVRDGWDGDAGWHPHDLRHRRASLWHQQGVPAVELARRLGHARPSMSLDVYSHVRPLSEIDPHDLVTLAK